MTTHKWAMPPSVYFEDARANRQRFWLRCNCGADLKADTKPALLSLWEDHRRGKNVGTGCPTVVTR